MTRPRRLPLATFSDPGLMQRLADIDPDLLISAGFGRIIPAGMLAIPRMGAFNCHPSPLPRYAGRNPWFWMLNKGETEGGVTIHRMVSAVDAGPIAAQTTFPIRPDMNFQDLYNLTSILSARMLRGWLRRWPGGVMGVSEQDLSLRTYFSGPEKNDYRIVWNSPAETIDNLVRAANPRPAAWTSFGNTRVRVIKIAIGAGGFGLAALPQGTDAPPGRVTHVDGNGVWVSCADGTVGIRLARVRGTEAHGMRLARLLGIAPGAQLK
jgi:methionyl-tRNA formyltransferase